LQIIFNQLPLDIRLYQLIVAMGINPLLLNKLLPPVLGSSPPATVLVFAWRCCRCQVGFTATLLLNQIIWMNDLVSATPRAFAYPLFLAFLYHLLRRSLLGSAVAIALLGLFYPHYVFVSAGILILRLFLENGRLSVPEPKRLSAVRLD